MKNILLIICLCFIATGCNSNFKVNTTETDGNGWYDGDEIKGISMTIKKDTLTREGATIIISDSNGKGTYVYGEPYRIDKKENGKWEEIKTIHDDYGFNDMAYYVDETGKLEFKYDWKYIYGKLSNGEYRLVKYTFLESDTPITDEDKLYFSVEFTIE